VTRIFQFDALWVSYYSATCTNIANLGRYAIGD